MYIQNIMNTSAFHPEKASYFSVRRNFFRKTEAICASGDSSFLWLLGLDINSVKKTVKKAIK